MSDPALTIDSPESLRSAIVRLQESQLQEGAMLKKQFKLTLDSMRPLNLMKGALKGVAQSAGLSAFFPDHPANETNSYSSALVTAQPSHSPIKSIVGSLLLLGISGTLAKNGPLLKSLGSRLVHWFKRS